MEKVSGIGGVFFRSRDPKTLNDWYSKHLGIEIPAWEQQAGTTAWAAFDADTDYFGRPDQPFMINFRVNDLAAMLAQLREAGVEVLDKVEDYDYGRFGWAVDPEGNRFELWQPTAP